MRRVLRGGAFPFAWICLSALAFGGSNGVAAAADESPAFAAHLAAGEFSRAFESASSTPDAKSRNRQFAALARAQAAAGATAAALSTLAEVDDDEERSSALVDAGFAGTPPRGARGGSGADFSDLISLITETVAPTSWSDVGGPGAISEFESGVRVDVDGVMRPVVDEDRSSELAGLRDAMAQRVVSADVRRRSPLRCVSLTRLERAMQLDAAAGREADEGMRHLAGLERVRYVLLFEDSRDVVLAGPAGDWTLDTEGRLVSEATRRPLLRLDDLVVLLRHTFDSASALYGCSIDPTPRGLADVREFLRQSSARPLAAGTRGKWMEEVRSRLGRQIISVHGIAPNTHVARTIIEADYHMKLVGIGLRPGTLNVPSYLDSIETRPGEPAPPMDVLRWWFTVNYPAVVASRDRDIFEITGQGVQLRSENEMLTDEGRRVRTGDTDALNAEFARRFTRDFEALAEKYPIYAELRNVFDLSLAVSLIKNQHLAERVDWRMPHFGSHGGYVVDPILAPREVDTVINDRVVHRTRIIAAVSGGVRVDVAGLSVDDALSTDATGRSDSQRDKLVPDEVSRHQWWWDPS